MYCEMSLAASVGTENAMSLQTARKNVRKYLHILESKLWWCLAGSCKGECPIWKEMTLPLPFGVRVTYSYFPGLGLI